MATLDEMINEHERTAEGLERQANIFTRPNPHIKGSGRNYINCRMKAAEEMLLTRHLKELRAYKKAKIEIAKKCDSGQWNEAVIYGMQKALFIMNKCVSEELNENEPPHMMCGEY